MYGADGNADVGGAQCVDHLVDGEADRRQAHRIDVDLDLPRHRTGERNAADAAHALEAFLHDLFAQRGEFARREVVCQQRVKGHRLVIFVPAPLHHRVLHVARERAANLGHFVAHVLQHAVLVDVEAEFDPGVADAFVRGRQQALDSGNRIGGVLDRLGYVVFDLLGGRTRIHNLDRNVWRAHVGHRLDAQPLI